MARVEVHIVGFAASLKKAVNEGITGLNKISAVAKRHEQSLRSMRMKSGIALTGGILLVRSLVKAYEKQEQADIKLAQAMKNRGIYTEEAFKQTKAFADEMQRLTTFGNEEVETVQTLLVSLGGLSGEGLDRATQATLDLAVGMKMDLTAAANMMAKSIGSTTNALTRYGIEMKEGLIDPQERAASLIDTISKKFGGQAEAVAQGTGQLKQLANIWGDLKEDLGEAILPMILKLATYLKEVLPKVRDFVQENKNLIMILAGAGIGGTGLILALSSLALAFTNPVTGIIAVVVLAAAGIALLVGHMKDLRAESEKMVEFPFKLMKTEELQEEIDHIKKYIKTLIASQDDMLAQAEAIKEIPFDKRTDEQKADLETLTSWLIERVEQIGQAKHRLTAALEAMKVKLQEPMPGETLGEEPAVGGIEFPEEEGKAGPGWAKPIEEYETAITLDQEYWDLYFGQQKTNLETEAQMKIDARDKEITAEEEHIQKMKRLAEMLGWGTYRIMAKSFGQLFQLHMRFDKALLKVTADAFIGMLNMAIDAAVEEIITEEVLAKAKLLIRGIFDWSALAKIALVSIAAGTAKSALEGLRGGITGKLSGKKFKYGGVLPETGWYFGEAGERFFNPEEPVDSALNLGGGLTFNWQQYGPVNDREGAEEAFREFGENILYGQIGRRMSTI